MGTKFDAEGLAKNDGKEGRPTYISHGGRVIDVSASQLWEGGLHMGRHGAGKDLTADIEAAPHGTEVLDRYPQVGTLVKEGPRKGDRERSAGPALWAGSRSAMNWALFLSGKPRPVGGELHFPPVLEAFLGRYPFLRRHPHPATVHFPIVLTLGASFFSILSALTGRLSFDQTSFYCLIGALIFMPLGIVTGLFTWWINYMARPMRPITIKKYVSFASLAAVILLFLWRLVVPGVLRSMSAASGVYLILMVALIPAVLTIAYYGGTLTFPVHGK